jgi:hypothetical protein
MGFLQSGPMLSISANGSFHNTKWNFVIDLVTLLVAKVESKLQNHAWGEFA